MKNSDRILADVWRAKDALGKRFGYDVHRLAEHFRRPETDPVVVEQRKKAPMKSSARRKPAGASSKAKV